MRRIIGIFIVILFLTPLIMPSLKHFWAGKQKGKQIEPDERQLIGRVSENNPRVKEIQASLSSKGIDIGDIDGYMGQKTREGIKKFQQANNLKTTGVIDSATLSAIEKIKVISSDVDKEDVLSKSAEKKKAETIENHTELQEQKTSDIHDEVLSYRLQSKERVRQIQKALQKTGYYKGEIDGKIGLRTKRAIKEFQRAKKLNSDGIVGEKTWEALSQYLKN